MRKRGALYSAGLHAIILMIAYLGLPDFLRRDIPAEPMVIAVDILPISEMTNVPKSKPKPKKKTKAKSKPSPKIVPKPKPKPKRKPKPETPKKDDNKEKPQKDNNIEKEILKDKAKQEEKSLQKEEEKEKANDKNIKTKSDKPYNPQIPLSLSEKDAILQQFYKCWTAPAGSADGHKLSVLVRVKIREDGYVTAYKIDESLRTKYNQNSYYRAAIDNVVRAIKLCNPIKNLPKGKYETWKEMELNFNPRDMLY